MTSPSHLTVELSRLTVADLRSAASALEIPGRSKMRKAELVEALSQAPGVERFVPGAGSSNAGPASAQPPSSGPTGPRTRAEPASRVHEPAATPRRRETRTDTTPGPEPRVVRAAGSTKGPDRTADPHRGGSGRLGLVAVDPTCVFVFWDVEEELIARARDCVGDAEAAVVLRMSGVAGNGSGPGAWLSGRFDLFIERAKGEQYLQLSVPGQTVSCELGVESRDGRFHAFAWSNRLELPADHQAATRETRRMRIGGDPSGHWQARGAARPSAAERAVVAAEAALPTDADENASRGPEPVSDVVMPPEEMAALLFESREFTVGLSSAELRRRARRGLFSGALGVSSSSLQETWSERPAHGGGADREGRQNPNRSRRKVVLPGLVASASETSE